jgi:hypothetical protein
LRAQADLLRPCRGFERVWERCRVMRLQHHKYRIDVREKGRQVRGVAEEWCECPDMVYWWPKKNGEGAKQWIDTCTAWLARQICFAPNLIIAWGLCIFRLAIVGSII